MSLYYDAASILSSQNHGSLKSLVYNNTNLKSNASQVYALVSQTAKRDNFLTEVIENAELLKDQSKLSPLLALLLCHDYFFAKSGIAAPAKHPLRLAIEAHKARLQSEFTRARLRLRCATVDVLKLKLDNEAGREATLQPRWARINTLKAEDVDEAIKNIVRCSKHKGLQEILEQTTSFTTAYCEDKHIPKLLAFSPTAELTITEAYKQGQLILQDKASCFPAHLLLGNEDMDSIGDVMDGCAAPGNKTTHVAAGMHELGCNGKIFACERDPTRSRTLQSMVAKAGASKVEVLAKQDFLALDPSDPRFANVTHLLVDPSCSGSGILGREDIPKLVLPDDPRAQARSKSTDGQKSQHSKKRKRGAGSGTTSKADADQSLPQYASKAASVPAEGKVSLEAISERLHKLSNLQTRIVEHAMKFPAATRITYSTCSIHEQENEAVVSRVLASRVVRTRGWKVLRRDDQVEGMRKWRRRGVKNGTHTDNKLEETELEACIRCTPHDEEGTMGFFVCGFVREGAKDQSKVRSNEALSDGEAKSTEDEEEVWEGFD